MKRLMTTAATIVALSTTAHAQDAGGAFTDYQVQPGQDLFASELMGSRLYSTEGEVSGPVESGETSEWNDLGEINDIVLSEDGSVEVIVVGIGGFLGIGERNAAVSMDDLQIVRNSEDEGEFYLVINSTQEEIESAPEFVRGSETEQSNAGTSTDTNAGISPEQAEPGAENIHQNLEETGRNMAQPAEDIENTGETIADDASQEAGEVTQNTGQAAEEGEDATSSK